MLTPEIFLPNIKEGNRKLGDALDDKRDFTMLICSAAQSSWTRRRWGALVVLVSVNGCMSGRTNHNLLVADDDFKSVSPVRRRLVRHGSVRGPVAE